MQNYKDEERNLLHNKLSFWRAERPDEWTMDEFIRDAKYLHEENSKLRDQLESASEQVGQLQLAHEYAASRAEAAEARLKAASEQEPVLALCIEPSGVIGTSNILMKCLGWVNLPEPLYASPVPQIESQELLGALREDCEIYQERIAELERKLAKQQSAYAKLRNAFESVWNVIPQKEHFAQPQIDAANKMLNTAPE